MGLEERITFAQPEDLSSPAVMRVENSARLWRVSHESCTVCLTDPAFPGWSERMIRGRVDQSLQSELPSLQSGKRRPRHLLSLHRFESGSFYSHPPALEEQQFLPIQRCARGH